MTDVRHDGGTAGSGRDAWIEPGQDLDALLSRWNEQPGPFRSTAGRHSAPDSGFRVEPGPLDAGWRRPRTPERPPMPLPPSGRRFRDDDAPPPPWVRQARPSRRGHHADGDDLSSPAPRAGGPAGSDRSERAERPAPAADRVEWGNGGSAPYGPPAERASARPDRGRDRGAASGLPPVGYQPDPVDPWREWDHRDPQQSRPAAAQPRPAGGPAQQSRPAGGPALHQSLLTGPPLTGPPLTGPPLTGPPLSGRMLTGPDRSGPDRSAPDRSAAGGAAGEPGSDWAGQVPSFDDTGAYAGWLSRGGLAGTTGLGASSALAAGGGVLAPPRPTATGGDLLTHDPAYQPYADPYDDDPYGAGWADDDDPPPPRRHRRAGSGRPRWLRILGWVGAFLGILVVAGGGFATYQYKKLNSNINRSDALATDDKAIRDAAKQLDAENYLLLGSDTRAGANGRYEDNAGQVSGERSDTTILAHLSPNRDKATMISFPRDSWVLLPACRKKDGTMAPERYGQFNEAFATGGPQCAVLAVQKLTGIRINHYVQVDFSGFKTMVDAVGGVPICTTTRLRDDESGLRLDPGTTNLRGEQALAYVRARYGIGDGSDLGRIQRQQRFLGAMVRKATSAKLLVNPVALTKFLNAATKSLTLDKQTSLGDLKTLADQLRDLDPKRVGFLTAPIANPAYNPPGFPPPPPGRGGSKVLLDDVAGRKLWDAIINDKPAPPKTAPKPAGPPKPTVLTVAPDDVTVKVLNGVGLDGLARKVAGEMESAGFKTVEPTNAAKVTTTTVRYAPSQVAAARTVAAAVPGAVLQPSASVGTAIELVVGPDYTGVVTVKVGDPATAKTVAAPKPPAPTTSGPKPAPAINAADATCT